MWIIANGSLTVKLVCVVSINAMIVTTNVKSKRRVMYAPLRPVTKAYRTAYHIGRYKPLSRQSFRA